MREKRGRAATLGNASSRCRKMLINMLPERRPSDVAQLLAVAFGNRRGEKAVVESSVFYKCKGGMLMHASCLPIFLIINALRLC